MSATTNIDGAAGLLAAQLQDGSSAETLALLKLRAMNESGLREGLSEPGTPTGGRGERGQNGASSWASSAGAGALTRTTRKTSSVTSRRTTSLMQSHRHKMSVELSAQAEKHFSSLMELMDSAHKEASSVKECWSQLMSERESDDREKEELLLRIEEISQAMEQKEGQHDHHRREATHRKKELEKLLIEFTATLAIVAEQKKKITDREHELERSHVELSDVRTSLSRSHIEHDQIKASLEGSQAKWRVTDAELSHLKDELERARNDFRSLTREHTEMGSRNSNLVTSLESARKENSTLTERVRSWEIEKNEVMFEKDKIESNLRKQIIKMEEMQREITDVTEHNERLHREHAKFKELISRLEAERDEHQSAAARARADARATSAKLEESEEQQTDALLKLEQFKRHITRKDEALLERDSGIADLQRSLASKHEEYRVVIMERDQLKDDVASEHKALHDARHRITGLEDLLAQSDTKLTQQRSETYAVVERVKQLEHDRDGVRGKHDRVVTEVESLKARIILLQGEVRTANENRDNLNDEVARYRRKYEEVTETIEEWNDNSGDLEFELESLRVMLREAREQKEKAIAARNTADRERDEHIALYEEKCRELERFEENGSRATYVHAGGHGGYSSSRVVSSKSARTSSVRQSYNGEGKVEEEDEDREGEEAGEEKK